MVHLGELELGRIPRIAVAVSDVELRTRGAEARALADVIELRIDRFERHEPAYLRVVCEEARSLGLPLLATVRDPREGGESRLGEEDRVALFETVAPLVDGLDIELGTGVRDRVISLGRRHGKLVLVSHHDFRDSPSDDQLTARIRAAREAGADVVKIAVTATDSGALDRLTALLRRERYRPLVLIAMGEHGIASRVFFPLLGSILTYGFLDRAVAPGQLALAELAAELCRYSPEFALDRRRRHADPGPVRSRPS